MPFYMFHENTPNGRCFQDDVSVDELVADGWVDTPAKLGDDKNKDDSSELDRDEQKADDVDSVDEAEAEEEQELIELAKRNGIKIDKRWGLERLREEVLGE